MKRRTFAVFTALLLAGAPSVAAQGPKPKAAKAQASAPKPVKVTKTSVKPVKATSGHASKSTVKASKTTKSTTARATTKVAKPAKAEKLAKAEAGKTDGSTPLPDSTSGTTLTPVQQKLKRNTNLAAKLEGRLPKGTDLMTAAEGFRNLGQFVAAVNVSNNLGIPFADLKTRMVTEGYSLGQSIQSIKREADGPLIARRAETEAQRLIATTETQTGSTTTATTTAAASKKPKKTI